MQMKYDFENMRAKVIAAIDMSNEISDELLHKTIDEVAFIGNNKVPIKEKYELHKEIYDSIRGLGVIENLLKDQAITEIMINGAKKIFVEKRGEIKQIEASYSSDSRLEDIIQQIVGQTNKRINESNPIVDTRLSDGSRVNVVVPPIALDGPIVTIRKFPNQSITMEDLIKWNSITAEAAVFLERMVCAGYNIFISGGTGSGKTTFLNVLSNFIPSDERIITIEDSAELQIQYVSNLVRMETRDRTSEGTKEITIRDLIKTSLRMRPDRIIVGEVRGPEALDMLQAMNTGHDGSMSTGHGNSPPDMIARLETMILTGIEMPLTAIRAQIASGIDIMIHLGRLNDKSRKVIEIDEISGIENQEVKLIPLFALNDKNLLVRTSNKMANLDKLKRKEGDSSDI